MNKGKVFVGMSGGVDSSVSAALLKKEGYDVVGVFIKVWEPDLPGFEKICTWRDDRRDAIRVAAKLNIPFMTIDLSDEYKKEVIDYMINEYRLGRTPNPDVMCNKQIKFGLFFKKAMEMGADYVATGHYARRIDKNSDAYLLAGKDDEKDQSYFLWTLKQEQLKKCLFPVGRYEKPEVRKLAKKFVLPNAEKKDSQGLCFIGKVDVNDFLKEFIEEKQGDVLDEKGNIVGQHEGVFFYTIGQRHGFVTNNKETKSEPYYIVDKDVNKNILVVSKEKVSEEYSKKEISLIEVNWISSAPKGGKKYKARSRYRQDLIDCVAEENNDKIKIIFDKPQMIAPGQSLVLYDGETCLGGGVIS